MLVHHRIRIVTTVLDRVDAIVGIAGVGDSGKNDASGCDTSQDQRVNSPGREKEAEVGTIESTGAVSDDLRLLRLTPEPGNDIVIDEEARSRQATTVLVLPADPRIVGRECDSAEINRNSLG